ncbi:MAG: T9SS type A sorting domain-containing protein [Bacteroidota bacterium]
MRKTLPVLFVVALLASLSGEAIAQRYNSEVFTDVQITPSVRYGQNKELLTGAPVMKNLTMDVYEPFGDAQAVRPLIIYLHTGSFLPPVINSNPTGSRFDSTAVEMCKRFARRGYVAAAMSYRLGWNPVSADQDVRTGSLLQAVYRAMQDAKACVRYFYEEAAVNGNPFRVDTNNIILGGQGTGGYIAMAYATVDQLSEISLPKFLSNTSNPSYGFFAGQSYVIPQIWGDFDGYGGDTTLNYPFNHVGYSNRINFVFNMGGALGDSSWLEQGDVPMVAFHVIGDPFAPIGNGPVYVPTQPPQYVVDVSGSSVVVARSNAFGNNNCFNSAGFTDVYTQRANTLNNGEDGMFPFQTSTLIQSGPWEWYDSTALVGFAQFIGQPAAAGTQAYLNGKATNPDMSKAKAMAYIDTIQGYLNPRIVQCLGLNTGINDWDAVAKAISVYPNPTAGEFNVDLSSISDKVNSLQVMDINGRIIQNIRIEENAVYTFRGLDLARGLYTVKIGFETGSVTRKLVVQ